MKRIALITLTALAALVLAAAAQAAAGDPSAPAPRAASAPAHAPKAKATRRLSINLIPTETTSIYIGCIPVYWAGWGGWETQCAFTDFHQGVKVGDEKRFYYWDGACWRFYQYYFRGVAYLGSTLNPWVGPYAAPRTCF
jgi:hypothetical protein